MVIEYKDTYKCILESMHAAILRIMRMTQKTNSSYSELTKLLRDVETRL